MIWPIHPHPFEDELLSSWMVRVAHANRYKVHDFYAQQLGKEKQIWTRDIDHLAPKWLLGELSNSSGINFWTIERTSLSSFCGILIEDLRSNGITKGILPLGVYHRLRKFNGQLFCPYCLADGEPYFRKSWRVAYLTVCPKHFTYLRDCCSQCQQPVLPFRCDMVNKVQLPIHLDLAKCWHCDANLRLQKTKLATYAEIRLSSKIQFALNNNYVYIKECYIPSIVFFKGIRVLAQGLQRLNKNLDKSKNKQTELMKLSVRRELYWKVSLFLLDWPDKFKIFAEEIPHPFTTFILRSNESCAPNWVCKSLVDPLN